MKRFNWVNFSAQFLNDVLNSHDTPAEMRPKFRTDDVTALVPFMDGISSYPDKYFIRTYRNEIEYSLLRDDRRLLLIAYAHCTGKKIKNAEISSITLKRMFEEMRRKPPSSSLIGAYKRVLQIVGAELNDDEFFTRFDEPISIDLKKTAIPDVPLHGYQLQAVEALKKGFITNDSASGLLVMPTASGKTRTAAYFLLTHMISEGYQVVWLTHRHLLIEQPAENFYDFAGLVKTENPAATRLNMLCVSGEHASIRRAEKTDDILVLSVQSVVRSLDFLKRILRNKVVVVVDEAHHTVAASYRKIINCIRSSKSRKITLLGLTATPVRMSDRDTAILTSLFGNNIIYSVSTADLIKQGKLAEPVFEQVNTNYEVSATLDERKYIQKYGEIDPSLVDKIARSGERNDVIVNQYMDNRERYGKTLIFALNIYHCITLREDFSKRGVKCDFIYSGKKDNTQVIENFRRDDGPDVLININILTEGSDVPNIQTVFLTRPTKSEVLLMQMIGRGLRGVDAGGTEKAYIVDFNDKWDTFVKWLNPQFVLNPPPPEPTTPPHPQAPETESIPLSVIADIYSYILYDYSGTPVYNTIIPYGWYNAIDDEGNDMAVLVTEAQLKGYLALEDDKNTLIRDESLTGANLQKYFTGFTAPPLVSELQAYLDIFHIDKELPIIHPFAERREFDPYYIAKRIGTENLDYKKMNAVMDDAYGKYPLAQEIFTGITAYKDRVYKWLNGDEQPIGAIVEELPVEQIPWDYTPCYDLQQLLGEVNAEMFGERKFTGMVSWTPKCYKGYFGVYYVASGEIRINKLLNSRIVPREVIKYLLYHELLHRDYPYHDSVFYEKEHMYPNWVELDAFLDGQMHKFDLGGKWEW